MRKLTNVSMDNKRTAIVSGGEMEEKRWKTSKTNRYTHVINSQDLMVPMVLTTCKTQRAEK